MTSGIFLPSHSRNCECGAAWPSDLAQSAADSALERFRRAGDGQQRRLFAHLLADESQAGIRT